MQFFSPLGAIGLVTIPAVIALYLLRQQFEEIEISSTYLWKMAVADQEASRPFQKLKRNLLLFMQLLVLGALCFSLLRPALIASYTGSRRVIIIDMSASMMATDVAPSRFENAREQILAMVDGMMPGDEFSIITAGSTANMLAARQTDKGALRRIVAQVEPETGSSAIDEALSLATALQRESEGLIITVFSDKKPDLPDGAEFVIVGAGADNVAVAGISAREDEGGNFVLAQVRNYGAARTSTLECYADGELTDVREVELEQDGVAAVLFNGIPPEASYVEARLTESDALAVDDSMYLALSKKGAARVLLVTKSNVFLEKVLALREDLAVFKTTPGEASQLLDFDLYIFDGELPDELPSGHIWHFAANDEEDAEPVGGALMYEDNELSKNLLHFIDASAIQVQDSSPLVIPGLTPILTNHGEPVVAAGTMDQRRVAEFGFDLHISNLPLLKDFPILIQNLLQWTLPQLSDIEMEARCGEAVTLSSHAYAKSMWVETPSGRRVELAPPFPARALTDTFETGLYSVYQEIEAQGETEIIIKQFSVHIPVETESDLRFSGISDDASAGSTAMPSARDLTPVFLALCIALLLVEWGVYCRGY